MPNEPEIEISKKGKRELIAKVKFWFGIQEEIQHRAIFKENLEIDIIGDFAYIYRKL